MTLKLPLGISAMPLGAVPADKAVPKDTADINPR